MSGKDNDLPSTMQSSEIKTNLLSIFDKIARPSTKDVGYELFTKLVQVNIFNSQGMNYLIAQIGKYIAPISNKEKEAFLRMLSLVFYSGEEEEDEEETNKNIYYQYLSPVLSILQSLIKESNSSLFNTISTTFAEIVQNLMPTDLGASNVELDPEQKRAYEMLQGFCIYNMKFDDKSNKIVGSLCLTKLVENCPIVLQPQYMKFIWDSIINLVDKKNFSAQSELLNCLISLVLGAENLFTPFANVTLYKVLDFLTDKDWLKRKLALNVIYTLIFYCKEEILPLKDHIVNFLKVLKTDKVKEVREVCILILQIFSDYQPKKREPVSSSIAKEREKTIRNNKIKNNNLNSTKEGPIHSKSNSNINSSTRENFVVTKEDEEGNRTPLKDNKNFYMNKTGEFKEQLNNNIETSNTNKTKCVNRKGGVFVNEKMVIKPDPSKSIFKATPNPAFFNQSKANQSDIIVVSKGKPQVNKQEVVKVEQTNKSSKKETNRTMEQDNNYKEINNSKVKDLDIDISNNISNDLKIEQEKELEITKHKKILTTSNSNSHLPKNNEEKASTKPSISHVLNSLLAQMTQLSNKQLSLIDFLGNVQNDTQSQIDDLDGKIENLESTVESLKSELEYLKNYEQE